MNNDFYNIKDISLKEFTTHFNNEINDINILNDFSIEGVSSINLPKKNTIIFISKRNIEKFKTNLDKNFLFLISDDEEFYKNIKKSFSIAFVKNIDLVYNKFLSYIYITDDHTDYEDDYDLINGSYISKKAIIKSSVKVYPGSIVSKGCTIDENTIIKQNCTIKYCHIGQNNIIQENVVIGSTGFGFPPRLGAKFIYPHVGIVAIGDNCSIGANCTIDRGRIDYTTIKDNTVLDNNIHIAHNVTIGFNSTIAAQTGISGSVKIGDNFLSGGQVGIAGHLTIDENVTVAAKSGITKNISKNSIVAGFPAVDINTWKKQIINQKKYGHK
jgi:UDP-3-O-[3-hydroxymyristoyl] glucosamine N-acyltransferase